MKIMLRNITQAYTLSKIRLNHTVICYLSVKQKKRYPKSKVLLIVKQLYSLVKAENHQSTIYLNHHKEKLGIKISPYDAYLLITKNRSKNFGIVNIQTDNMLNIRMEAFIKKEETEIIETKFKT